MRMRMCMCKSACAFVGGGLEMAARGTGGKYGGVVTASVMMAHHEDKRAAEGGR
jgi:hypothetical protein